MNQDKVRKRLFYLAVAACFLTILVYNILTPMLSDDLNYGIVVHKATKFTDLFRQEYQQYMVWTGRSPSHMLLRIFLYSGSKQAFNLFSSICFTALTLFMYLNIEHRKKYDVLVYTLITLSIWIFGVSFAETVLWETGACNYMIAMTVIMGYLTAFRYLLRTPAGGNNFLRVAGMFLLGLWAGWCNENTSGGAILLVLIWLFLYLQGDGRSRETAGAAPAGRRKLRAIRPWMVSGLAGNVIGFLFMIMAPGNAVRAGYKEELHTGLFGMASRWLKITLVLKDEFMVLLCIFLFLFILLRYQKTTWKTMQNMLLYFLIFLATCYALVMAPEPQVRAYFGAGIFLIIACVQGFCDIRTEDTLIHTGRTTVVMIMLLYMAFTYLESGANLARIYREENERYEYLAQKAAEGEEEVTLPMLRPDFKTKYSMAYASDIEKEKEYWVNIAYAYYYGINWVDGVPRAEWTEY